MPCDDTAMTRCLTPRELAQRWRCRVATVRQMVRNGAIEAIRLGGAVRILPESIQRAERGSLAVRPVTRRRRAETVPREVAELLA